MTVLSALRGEEIDRITLLQGDDRLLPVLHLAVGSPHAAVLAAHDERVDAEDLHLEEGLDRVPDLDLVGTTRDLEHDLVRVPELARLLGQDDGFADDGLGFHFVASFAVFLAGALAAFPGTGTGTGVAPSPGVRRQRCSSAFAASFERTSVS